MSIQRPSQPASKPKTAATASKTETAKPAASATSNTTQAKAASLPADSFKKAASALQEGLKRVANSTNLVALRTTAAAPKTTTAAASPRLQELQNSPTFKGLNATQQQQALNVFNKTSVDGQKHFVTLANRTVGAPPKPALLDLDSKGNTLLSNLNSFANATIDPKFAQNGITRESLLATTIQEAGQPGQVNQSSKGTCTVTSMQYMLCKHNPSEYARLVQGLAGPTGEVKLKNGDTLKRVSDSVANDTATARSASERIFQAAMMDYSNGPLKYSNTEDKNNLLPGFGHGGLIDFQIEKGMQGLFGQDYQRTPPLWKGIWGGQDVVDSLSKQKDSQAIICLGWGEKNFLGLPSGGHAVVGTKVENGRVYFRNPWGPTGDAAGTTYQNPPRRMEDPSIREESMTIADFKKWVMSAFVP